MNLFGLVAYAQTTTPSGATGEVSPVMAGIVQILPLIAIIVVMYFIMIRPQRKKEKELRNQISKMKAGDKVVTIGGIVGKIHSIKDNTVIIETGNIGTPTEKSYIKFEKDAIKSIEVKLEN